MDLHQGKFKLQSKQREGTTVTVMLPRERVMDTLPAVEDATGRDTRKSKSQRTLQVEQTPASQTPLPAQQPQPESD